MRVSFDPNLRPALWSVAEARAATEELLPYVDIALPSGPEESEQLFGASSARETADYLHSRGVDTVAVKQGEAGVLLEHRRRLADHTGIHRSRCCGHYRRGRCIRRRVSARPGTRHVPSGSSQIRRGHGRPEGARQRRHSQLAAEERGRGRARRLGKVSAGILGAMPRASADRPRRESATSDRRRVPAT